MIGDAKARLPETHETSTDDRAAVRTLPEFVNGKRCVASGAACDPRAAFASASIAVESCLSRHARILAIRQSAFTGRMDSSRRTSRQ